MEALPSTGGFEESPALLREGYLYGSNRFARLHTDIFETRLMLQPAIVMMGEDAAHLICDTARFARKGALPHRVLATLTGRDAVQGLDDGAHARRKQLFLDWLMDTSRLDELALLFEDALEDVAARWTLGGVHVLHQDMEEALCAAACRWAGLAVPAAEVPLRTRQLAALIEGAGAVGMRHWRAVVARNHLEDWLVHLVHAVRRNSEHGNDLLHAFCFHSDEEGRLLPARVVAVELINVLRPMVGVARYVSFAALAMHAHPEYVDLLRAGSQAELEQFVDEVRRFYPFVPMVAARVRTGFDWRGIAFPRHRRVLLDLYATNHDPRLWTDPQRFRPERFAGGGPGPYGLIPQGPGDYAHQHRCAGEAVTRALTGLAVRFLAGAVRYTVPEQDLAVDLARMPTGPASGFVVADVQRSASWPRGHLYHPQTKQTR